jgi:hypothetical protein
MPYIDQGVRDILEPEISQLIRRVEANVPEEDREGVANYVISRLVANIMRPGSGWRYKSLSRAAEVFASAGHEFRRRMLDPYEDKAIAKNGDVPEYDSTRSP